MRLINCQKSTNSKSFKSNVARLLRTFGLPALTAVAMTSCVYDDIPADASADGTYTLRLNFEARGLDTRSATHSTEVGSDAENHINIDGGDYAVFIFDGDGRYLQRFEPGMVSLTPKPGNTWQYSINGAFTPERDITGEDIQIMMLANWQTDFKGSYNSFEDLAKTRTIADIYADAADFNYTMPAPTWGPATGGIPMFGLSDKVNVTNPIIEFTNSISMLRSMAKLEIVDKAQGEPAHIEKVVLTRYNTSGRFIPEGDATKSWPEVAANAAGKTSLPAGVAQATTELPFLKTTRQVVPNGATAAEERDVYMVYIPEMEMAAANLASPDPAAVKAAGIPVIEVYVKDMADPYVIYLAEYDDNGKPMTSYTKLLRNHIYRYNILSVGISAQLTLNIQSERWDLDDDEYDYVDAVSAFAENHSFQWQWSPDNYDVDEEILSVGGEPQEDIDSRRRNIIVTQADGIEGIATFTISEPKRGTWTLSLISDDFTPNHWFRIDRWDPDSQSWILGPDDSTLTGMIGDGTTEVKIRIVGTDLQYVGYPYTARLMMNATTFDGRMVELNLSTSDPMQAPQPGDYYYVKQNTTPLE